MLNRRALLAAPLLAPALASAQTAWPERPVRVIVPFPPAGSTDVLMRVLAEQLGQRLGQPFVIENRPGAGGNIGVDQIAKSAPDGYTIGAATLGAFSINQYLYARLPYDPDRDLLPVSLTWDLPNVAVVSAQHNPARTFAEFIAWARAQRNGVTYGSPGVGTSPHLSSALLFSRLGIEATHVPFRGAAQTIPAMLSGDVNFALDNLPSYLPVIQGGQMRALAVTSEARWPTVPDVPTMAQAGIPDFVVTSWASLVVPRATPRAIVDRIGATLRAIEQDAAVQGRFAAAGAKMLWSTPEQAEARGVRERPMWQEAVRLSGARAD